MLVIQVPDGPDFKYKPVALIKGSVTYSAADLSLTVSGGAAGPATTDDLPEGSINKYFSGKTTSNLPEGSNKYFTDERARDAVGSILTNSGTIQFEYDDVADTIAAAVITSGLNHPELAQLLIDSHPQYQKETDFTEGSVLFRGASVISENNATLYWDNSFSALGIGGQPAHELDVTKDSPDEPVVGRITNTSGTGNAHAILRLEINGSSNGDPKIYFAGGSDWGLGVDVTDSSSFKISASSALESANMFSMRTTGESGWRGATPVANVNHTIKLFATSAAKGIRIIDSGVILMATVGKLATSNGGGLDVFNSSGGIAGRFGAGVIGSVHSFLTEAWFGLGNAVPTAQLHVESPNAVLNGVAQIHVTPSEGHAADRGGAIGLRGYTNSTGSPTNFAVLAGRKENGTALNQQGYFSLGVNDGSAVVERVRITSDGRIGFGGVPGTSMALDVQSTTGAFVPPRMTTAQRNVMTATDGMVIYNTTTGRFEGYESGTWRRFLMA